MTAGKLTIMNNKYAVFTILVLLFGVTFVVFAEPPLQEINITDRLEIKEHVVIIKGADITNPHETYFTIGKILEEYK